MNARERAEKIIDKLALLPSFKDQDVEYLAAQIEEAKQDGFSLARDMARGIAEDQRTVCYNNLAVDCCAPDLIKRLAAMEPPK